MATANKVPLNTLKECLQFLEWLRSDNQGRLMQEQVAGELEKRLNGKYNGVDKRNIEKALPQFLDLVSRFYKKLVTETFIQESKTKANQIYNQYDAPAIFKALLESIPKILAACYFLQYHVDGRFKTLGGGEWAGDSVGKVADSGAGLGKIYSYLTKLSGTKYGVIPGGFSQSELKGGDKSGYKHGSVMVDDLEKILGEKNNGNLFLDVFSTSVSSLTGSQTSNTANALALLKIFCEIVAKEQGDGGALKIAVDAGISIKSTKQCVEWDNLKRHCATLKTHLDKLFANGLFSHTGRSPTPDDLNKEEFCKRMARWLRDYLDQVRGKLHKIETHEHLIDNRNSAKIGEYLNKYVFPFGFTFYNFGNGENLHTILNTTWKSVVHELNTSGLHNLVGILKGQTCYHDHGYQADFEEEDDDEEEEDVDTIVAMEDEDDDDDDSAGTPKQGQKTKGAQSVGQSEQNHGIPPATLGSDTPPDDGKGQGPSGSPGAAGKSLQVSGPPAQQPVPPQAAAHKSSTTTPSPGHAASGVSDTDSDPGAAGPKGDPGQTGPTGPVASASSDFSDAQVIQPPQRTLQSSPVSSPTPPASPAVSPKLTGQTGVLGAGSQDDASLGTQNTGSPQAMLAQASSISSPGSAVAGSLAPGSGQATQDPFEIEWHIELPPRKDDGVGDLKSADASLANRVNSLRYPQGIHPAKYPLTGPQTSRKARPQSKFASYQDESQETLDSSDPSDPHDTNESFEHIDFTIAPYDGFAGGSYIPSCQNLWYVDPSSITTTHPPPSPPPSSDHLPPPRTVRQMLYWLVGLNQYGLIGNITEHVESVLKNANKTVTDIPDAIDAIGHLFTLDASKVTTKLTESCHYASTVIHMVERKDTSNVISIPDFNSEYRNYYYSSDPACLLCQLRDYAYACYHQLTFLKSQCNRNMSDGGWRDCDYGSDVSCVASPLQAFLTDDWDSTFKTHPFDPCNICLKSRVWMGFRKGDFAKKPKDGSYLSYMLSPTCGGSDPLLTLSSYLNCLTRRTPRTTGELCAFLFSFGNVLYLSSAKLSSLGTALSKPHGNCPDWDQLSASDLQAVRGIRGTDTFNTIHDNDNAHPRTLSTLVGCSSDPDSCPPLCSPITNRAYTVYSPTFAHTYLSWAVYLPDRLWESLDRLRYDLEGHVSDKCSSLHQCDKAMTLLYLHGFTPPEGISQTSLTCSDIITKLKAVVDGKPIASLMTCMDDFFYRVRMPFIYTLIALWSVAALLLSYTILYRLDILYLCSHFIRSKASHLIDVKALLTNSRKMLSLYDADYFDDDPNDLVDQLN